MPIDHYQGPGVPPQFLVSLENFFHAIKFHEKFIKQHRKGHKFKINMQNGEMAIVTVVILDPEIAKEAERSFNKPG